MISRSWGHCFSVLPPAERGLTTTTVPGMARRIPEKKGKRRGGAGGGGGASGSCQTGRQLRRNPSGSFRLHLHLPLHLHVFFCQAFCEARTRRASAPLGR